MYPKPKKRLGQNFLVDKNIRNKIIAACEIKPSDVVLEIGAGKGELTGLIAGQAGKVYALEIDRDLLVILKDNLKGYKNIEIINQGILKFNLDIAAKKIKIIGDIPYYISSPIVEYVIQHRQRINAAFITVQKEFAERLIAEAGSKDYGSLSCFVQYYTRPQRLFLIKKACFSPSPKVDSCLVRLDIRKEPPVKVKDEKQFFKIIRTAFNQRRKTLRNSLKGLVSTEKLDAFFSGFALDKDRRPEQLSLADFANLANL